MDGIYEKLLAASRFPVPRSLQEQEVARRLTQNRQPLNFKNDEEKSQVQGNALRPGGESGPPVADTGAGARDSTTST